MPDDREPIDSVAAPAPAPSTVRVAGALVALEGTVGVVVALTLVARAALGADQTVANGLAEAVWFIVLGGGIVVGGVALFLGRRWGRSIAVVSQIVLLPVAWNLLTDSHQLLYGALLGIAVIGSLVLLFLPPSTNWAAESY